MRTKLLAVTLVGALLTTPAFAWGDREQGMLAGIASYWLFNKMSQPHVAGGVPNISQGQFPSYAGAVPPPPIIYQPNCRQVLTIQYDRYGNEYRAPMTICQ